MNKDLYKMKLHNRNCFFPHGGENNFFFFFFLLTVMTLDESLLESS